MQNAKCKIEIQNVKLFTKKYLASNGTEYFISYESLDRSTLYAFIRLRLSGKSVTRYQLPPIQNTALVRELHTYGKLAPLHTAYNTLYTQHQGLGKKLLAKAEEVAKDAGYDKIAVIAGVGVRGYYRKQGYELEDTFGYMIKKLKT